MFPLFVYRVERGTVKYQSSLWKYSNWSLNLRLLTKRITRAKIIRHLILWRSYGFPCVFKVDCNRTCLKQGGKGHILNIKQFIIMKESTKFVFSTGDKFSVLSSVFDFASCIISSSRNLSSFREHWQTIERANHITHENDVRGNFRDATSGISSRRVTFCALSRTSCLLK